MASQKKQWSNVFKVLRENSNSEDKRVALTYIRRNAMKVESLTSIKEEQYKELCSLIIYVISSEDQDIREEAFKTLVSVIHNFSQQDLKLFEALMLTKCKNRIKILQLLERIDDQVIKMTIDDKSCVYFFNDCLRTVLPSNMEWLGPTSNPEILQMLNIGSQDLPAHQKSECELIHHAMTLLTRFYRVANDNQVRQFDVLTMDKVITLAYMGNKEQRDAAFRLLFIAMKSNLISHVSNKFPEIWVQYKKNLQSTYCQRMKHLVESGNLDWSIQWNLSIQLLGIELHRASGLTNHLLGVEEKAFKSNRTDVRREAFLSWRLLIDNYALDPKDFATERRIKLLCIPLSAKNSRIELITRTKLDVWWHLIIKLYENIDQFVNPVITKFLNFCFGALGDTPMLSSKVIALTSEVKKYTKTKLASIDALCQLLIKNKETYASIISMLEEKLPHCISDEIFKSGYKYIIHSVGEALLIINDMSDSELVHRYELGMALWNNLIIHIEDSTFEPKIDFYKHVIIVVAELADHVNDKNQTLATLLCHEILPNLVNKIQGFKFYDNLLLDLVLKIIPLSTKNIPKKSYNETIKLLISQCIKPISEKVYYAHALTSLKTIIGKMRSIVPEGQQHTSIVPQLWCTLAEIATKYIADLQEINEGTGAEHKFETIESFLNFPFVHLSINDSKQLAEVAKVWKKLYQEFELQTDCVVTVKSNEILLQTATKILNHLKENKECYSFAVHCLDSLLYTINYNYLLAQNDVPKIFVLLSTLTSWSLTEERITDCQIVLKAFSAVLLNIHGHNPNKVVLYLNIFKPTIELVLKFEPDIKEIVSTWETIISIFRGLDKLLDEKFISSYKKVIVSAIRHPNLDIKALTLSILEINDNLNEKTKSMLHNIFKENIKFINETQPYSHEKTETPVKNVKLNSFLNKKLPKPTGTKLAEPVGNKILSPEPDSQDYVPIKTDFKFDVHRFTEHQKETLKRRRDDIPALYNDLSQSCSQDTQNLQLWFDNKKKFTSEVKINDIKTANDAKIPTVDHDPDKENKIAILESKSSSNDKLPSQDDDQRSLENDEKLEQDKQSTETTTSNRCNDENMYIEEDESASVSKSSNSESKDGSSNSLDLEYNPSPSMLSNHKRRCRSLISEKSNSLNSHIEEMSKSEKHKKTVKRRAVSSDTESEQSNAKTCKTLFLSCPSDNSQSTENSGVKFVSKRTTKEMNRLRIDMAFDSPLPNKRRSKTLEHRFRELSGKRPSPEGKVKKVGDAKKEVSPTDSTTLDVRVKSWIKRIVQGDDSDKSIVDDGKIVPSTYVARSSIQDQLSKEITDSQNIKTNYDRIDKSDSNIPIDNVKLNSDESEKKVEVQSSNDMDDIIENSQDCCSNTKQCFIKINKMPLSTVKPIESSCTSESVPNDSNPVEQQCANNDEKIPNRIQEPKDIEKNIKDSPPRVGKKDNSSESTSGNFSSPKSAALKRNYSKIKTYPTKGRAAHMLGLVTKQALLENDQVIKIDDEQQSTKTIKLKDGDRLSVGKEFEKIAGSSGSRQEKIFNNMRSPDYNSSPSVKMFCNLKNDGEKISLKLDKATVSDVFTIPPDNNKDKENEENPTSSTCSEKDELPILEWSSANPPSLSASPSVSILKRNRTVGGIESDTDTTPNKRKRVSFADPPVSKEMGYETIVTDSPKKANNKSPIRGGFIRKDSPFRNKQTKLKFIQMGFDKSDKKETSQMENIIEVDASYEQDNESSTKGFNDLECLESMPMDPDTSRNDKKNEKNNNKQIEESETQQDIFNDTEMKHHLLATSSIDPNIFGIIDDSLKDTFKRTDDQLLEDTVDIQNITRINSDKMFDDNPVQFGTRPADISRSDTIPITESMIASLPSSQSSTQDDNNIPHPELLDAVNPIYLPLISSQEPIDSIVKLLTNPLWINDLSSYFSNRGIKSIGDLAQLSEREINRIPVKGNPKIDFVVNVLKYFEKESQISLNSSTNTSNLKIDDIPITRSKQMTREISQESNTTIPSQPLASSTLIPSSSSIPTRTIGISTDTIPPPLTKSTEVQMTMEDLLDEIDVNTVLQSAVRRCTPENLLTNYKLKMTNTPDCELISATIRMLGLESQVNVNDLTLKTACRACGVNKVLLKLPDIFSADKQFFIKVLNAYNKKIQVHDCLNVFNVNEVKDAVQEKFTSSELAELMSKKLKDEENRGVTGQLTTVDVHQMLKRIPRDVVISQTVANDELIPSKVVLEIALQNSRESDIIETIQSQHPTLAKEISRRVWMPETVASKRKEQIISVTKLLNSLELTVEELVDVQSELLQSMKKKCKSNTDH